MTWLFNGSPVEEPPEDVVGFVYLITSLVDGRKYIGKKLLKFTRTKTIKGKKKKVKIDSDWKTYYGSNKELQEDVVAFGSDKFVREILYFCKSKGDCNYLEIREQCDRRVLESEEYYNSWISCKIHKAHVKLK